MTAPPLCRTSERCLIDRLVHIVFLVVDVSREASMESKKKAFMPFSGCVARRLQNTLDDHDWLVGSRKATLIVNLLLSDRTRAGQV